ncbi:MAG: hypothetical protein AAGA75_02260 [Cyanobacteria bacterium P01_E01_bin.6]
MTVFAEIIPENSPQSFLIFLMFLFVNRHHVHNPTFNPDMNKNWKLSGFSGKTWYQGM